MGGYTGNLVKSIQTYAAGPPRRKPAGTRIDPVSDRDYSAQGPGSRGGRPRRAKTPVFSPKEQAVLQNLQEFSKEELQQLNQQLAEARAAKLDALARANSDRAALSMELQQVLQDLTDTRVTAKQQQSAANNDRAFVARVLHKHRELVERYKLQKIQLGATSQDEMAKLERSVEELKFQLAQAKSLTKTLDELEQCNADTEKLSKLLHFHRIDLAIVKTGNRAALARAKAHKDALFKALVELESQLITAKADREDLLKKQATLQDQQAQLKADVESTESSVLKRELTWIKQQMDQTRKAQAEMAPGAGQPEPQQSAQVETVEVLRSQINGIDNDLLEMKHKALREEGDLSWDGEAPGLQMRARTAGTDGQDGRRYRNVEAEERLETKMRQLQQQVAAVEDMTRRTTHDKSTAEEVANENERLRRDKQLLEEQLCSIEAELDARDRGQKSTADMTEKELLEAELNEVEAMLATAGGGDGAAMSVEQGSPTAAGAPSHNLVSQVAASRVELAAALNAANAAKAEMAKQVASLQAQLVEERTKAATAPRASEDEVMEALTAREVAEAEKALMSEDLAVTQALTAKLTKELDSLRGQVVTVREEALTAADTERSHLQEENEMLEAQLAQQREEKERLLTQLQRLKQEVVHGVGAAAAPKAVPLPTDLPPPETEVRARVASRTKAAGGGEPRVEDRDTVELAQLWGMDFTWLGRFRWIPEKALLSALPVGWKELCDDQGRPYYYHVSGGKSTYAHPNDSFYKDLFNKIRSELESEQLREAEVMQKHAEASTTLEVLAAERERLTQQQEQLRRREEEVLRATQEAEQERLARAEKLEQERKKVREEEFLRLAGRVAHGLAVTQQQLSGQAVAVSAQQLDLRRQEQDQANYKAMLEYAAYLGMDPVADEHLLWIAEMALNAPCPDGWEELLDENGDSFFHNAQKDISTYEHPLDGAFRAYYRRTKGLPDEPEDPAGGPVAGTPGSGRPPLGPSATAR